MKSTTIYIDGQYRDFPPAQIHELTPGVLKARGVFETLRARARTPQAVELHFERFERGLKAYSLKKPFSLQRLKRVILSLLRSNHLANAHIRFCVWKDKNKTHYYICALPLKELPRSIYQQGVKARITTGFQKNHSRTSHLKTLNYSALRAALLGARAKGFHEVLFLNKEGFLVEGATANIFFIKNKILFTPKISCGCLNGITRHIVGQCAKSLRVPVKTVKAKVQKLYEADEAFLTNSLAGILPLRQVGTKKIGPKTPGPMTAKLMRLYGK